MCTFQRISAILSVKSARRDKEFELGPLLCPEARKQRQGSAATVDTDASERDDMMVPTAKLGRKYVSTLI